MVIDLFRNFQEEECSWIICFFPQNGEAALIVSGGLILFDKLPHKENQLVDVLIFAGFYDLLINLFRIPGLQNKSFPLQNLFQVLQQRTPVRVKRPCLQQRRSIGLVQTPFVADSPEIAAALLRIKHAVVAAFAKSIVLQPSAVLPL